MAVRLNIPDRNPIEIKRIVVKLGTKQITDIKSINHSNIENLILQLKELYEKKVEIIIVSSGAIGLGIYYYYGGNKDPKELSIYEKQALAGYGQVSLMNLLKEKFEKHSIKVGQVLLTHYIFDNRQTFLNAQNTLNTMLEMNIIPIINENDSVAVDEIKFGDNDRLGAYVSLLTDADLYIMLTDIDGFYENYKQENRKLVKVVDNIDKIISHAKDKEESFSKGGMITKLEAAKITAVSGIPCVIANGFKENIINKIFDNLSEGTIFLPYREDLSYRKKWITSKKIKGKVIVDEGAVKAILEHKSLLCSGIKSIEGKFKTGDTVKITDMNNNDIAIGISNYDSDDLQKIKGLKNSEIKKIESIEFQKCAIHIDNMVIIKK